MPTASAPGTAGGDGLDALQHGLARERGREQPHRVLGAIDEHARDVAQRSGLECLGRGQEGGARLGARCRRQGPGDHDGPGRVDAEAPCLRGDRRR